MPRRTCGFRLAFYMVSLRLVLSFLYSKGQKEKPTLATDEQIKLLHVLFGKIPNGEEEKKKLYAKAKVSSSKELTKKNATVMIEYLKKLEGKNENN